MPTVMNSSILTNSKAGHRDRLANFFSRLVDGDYATLAQEDLPFPSLSTIVATPEASPRSSLSSDDGAMPPTPEPPRRALSTISNDIAVAGDHHFTFAHPTHDFESLEELQRTAADEIAESRRKFQPLPADLRPRKMSLSTAEDVHTPPQSPKKPRFAAQVAGRVGAKDVALEAVGVCEDPFVRATPRRTRGAPETPRTQKKVAAVVEEADSDDEDIPFDFRSPSIVNEALVLSFMREMHERAFGYMGQREFPVTEDLSICLDPIPSPTFTREELLESAAEYREAHRPMKRRLSDPGRD